MRTRRVPDSFGFDWIRDHAGDLAVHVPVRPTVGRCIYLSPSAIRRHGKRARAHVEQNLLFRTDPFSAFPSRQEHARKFGGEKLLADLYACHGSISLGSGRAVFKGGYQLKGVGRTQLAGVHDFYKDSSGAATLFASFIEAANAAILARVLTFGAFDSSFIAILPAKTAGEHRTILGRRGSPIRLTHLEYLHGSLLRHGRDARQARWLLIARELLREIGPFPHRFDAGDVARAGRALLSRALVLTAEARLFGLELAFWGDNYDLFARVFDVGDTTSHFPHVPLTSELPRPSARVSPARFFSGLEVLPEAAKHFDFSLYPVRNALVALEILCTGSGLELAQLDRAFDWPWIEETWERALRHVLRRLGIPRRRIELPLVHRRKTSGTELDLETLMKAHPSTMMRRIGYGRLLEFRRALREDVTQRFAGPASRGERLPLWKEDDLLARFRQ